MIKQTLIATAISTLLLTGCQQTQTTNASDTANTVVQTAQTESEKANASFISRVNYGFNDKS